MITRAHVNQHVIRRNRAEGDRAPVLTVKDPRRNRYGHEARLKLADGTVVARLRYEPDQPLSCGATVWLETELEVEVLTR